MITDSDLAILAERTTVDFAADVARLRDDRAWLLAWAERVDGFLERVALNLKPGGSGLWEEAEILRKSRPYIGRAS